MTEPDVSRIESGTNSEATDSDFELLRNEGCKSVWHQLRAREGGRMLQGIEYESLSANLISEHDRLFNESEKGKLYCKEINWKVCVDVVEEAMSRNPVGVLCAFYKALIDTKDSGGATQHARIAERLAFLASDQRRKNDLGLPHGTMESEQHDGATAAEHIQGSPLPMAKLVSSPSTPLSMSPKKQDCSLLFALMNGGARCSTIVKLPPMPIELQVISSALLNNKIYISGIATEKEEGSLQVQVYSLSESEWSKLPEAPNHNAPVADVNGRITMIGGRRGKVNKSKPTGILSTWCKKESKGGYAVPSERKDSDVDCLSATFEIQGEWIQTLPPMPSTRVASGVCYHNNLLLVSGGFERSREGNEKFRVVDTVLVYNFSTQHWSALHDLQLPIALRSHHLVLCGQYVYLVGGAYKYPINYDDVRYFNSNAWRAKWTDVFEAIKLTSTEQQTKLDRVVWSPIAEPPCIRSTVVSCNNCLLSVGGTSEGLPQNAIYMLVDENTGSLHWIEVGRMRVGRYRHAVLPLGNLGTTLFIAGGYVLDNPEGDEGTEKTSSVELVLL